MLGLDNASSGTGGVVSCALRTNRSNPTPWAKTRRNPKFLAGSRKTGGIYRNWLRTECRIALAAPTGSCLDLYIY